MTDATRHPEMQYLDLLRDLLNEGDPRMDRTGVGTSSLFGRSMRFDLSDGTVPFLTTKRLLWRWALIEMLWFLRGETNIRSLLQQGVTIWSDWPYKAYCQAQAENPDLPAFTMKEFEAKIVADEIFAERYGSLGPVYGNQWTRWLTADGREINQVAETIRLLKEDPFSRRNIIEGWNVGEIDKCALPPCHKHYQLTTNSKGQVSMAFYCRSQDVLLGTPFNLAGASILLHILARSAGLTPGELIWFGGDVHLYSIHRSQALEQISRDPLPLAKLKMIREAKPFDKLTPDDFEVTGYQHQGVIKAPVAV